MAFLQMFAIVMVILAAASTVRGIRATLRRHREKALIKDRLEALTRFSKEV